MFLAYACELGMFHLYRLHLLTLSTHMLSQARSKGPGLIRHCFTTKGYPNPSHVRSRRCCGCKQGSLEHQGHDQQVLAQ